MALKKSDFPAQIASDSAQELCGRNLEYMLMRHTTAVFQALRYTVRVELVDVVELLVAGHGEPCSRW